MPAVSERVASQSAWWDLMAPLTLWTAAAAIGSMVAMAPQAMRSRRTGNASGVSAWSLGLVVVAAAWRVAYAVTVGAWIAALGTLITLTVGCLAWRAAWAAGCRDRDAQRLAGVGLVAAATAVTAPAWVAGAVGAVLTSVIAIPQAAAASGARESTDLDGVSVWAFGLAGLSSFVWVGYWTILDAPFGVAQSVIHGAASLWVVAAVSRARRLVPAAA